MNQSLRTDGLSVGYDGTQLLGDLNLRLERGCVLTLIGPNGAGKSTILKTITRQLAAVSGTVYIDGRELSQWPQKELARQLAVVLTDRIRPELMTCAEVVAMGRYPYTNLFGRLTPDDTAAVEGALKRVHGLELAQKEFATLSDGQRQRILLARAICQEPEVLVLDEPTAYLDIRHKIELLDILRDMTREKGTTVILSLHEIDLAMKVSDYLLCVKPDGTTVFGRPKDILESCPMEQLYELEAGSYNPLLGSVELVKTEGAPKVFVVAGGGWGIPVYRELQKRRIPFAAGILFEHDVDYQVARVLSDHVVSVPVFMPMQEEHYQKAAALMSTCRAVVDAGTPAGELNALNGQLLRLAKERNIPIYTTLGEEQGEENP